MAYLESSSFAIGGKNRLLPHLAPIRSYKRFSAFLGQMRSVLPTPIAMATKTTADSESPTLVPYEWSVVTFSLSCTVFKLFAVLLVDISYLGPPNWQFCP